MDKINSSIAYLRYIETYLDKGYQDEVPIFERLKYIATFSIKLNEYVASHEEIMCETTSISIIKALYKKRDEVFHEVTLALNGEDIVHQRVRDAEDGLKSYIHNLFYGRISQNLNIHIIDEGDDMPYLKGETSYIAASLSTKEQDINKYLIAELPADQNIIYTRTNGTKYILIEDVLLSHVNSLAIPYEVNEAIIIRLTRSDIEKNPVKLDISGEISNRFRMFFLKKLQINDDRLLHSLSGLSFAYIEELEKILSDKQLRDLTYRPLNKFEHSENMTVLAKDVKNYDIFVFTPYEPYFTPMKILANAASYEHLIEIRATINDTYNNAGLVDAMEIALKMGARVNLLVELKKGIKSERIIPIILRLEKAGAKIHYYEDKKFINFNYYQLLYNDPDEDRLRAITCFSTGDFKSVENSDTTDFSIVTGDNRIARELASYFDFLTKKDKSREVGQDIITGGEIPGQIMKLIEREKRFGEQGRIFIKVENLTNETIIDHLISAANNGVMIKILISGANLLDSSKCGNKIQVKCITGRFTERSKVYIFGSKDRETGYISSADFDEDSMHNCNSLAIRIKNNYVLSKIKQILYLYEKDSVDSRTIGDGGRYLPVKPAKQTSSVYDALSVAHFLQR